MDRTSLQLVMETVKKWRKENENLELSLKAVRDYISEVERQKRRS